MNVSPSQLRLGIPEARRTPLVCLKRRANLAEWSCFEEEIVKLLERLETIGYTFGECIEKVWNFTMALLVTSLIIGFWAGVAYLAWSLFWRG